MLKKSASFIEVKVEAQAQVKQIKTLHLALPSTLACSVSLAAALLDSLFEHPVGGRYPIGAQTID